MTVASANRIILRFVSGLLPRPPLPTLSLRRLGGGEMSGAEMPESAMSFEHDCECFWAEVDVEADQVHFVVADW